MNQMTPLLELVLRASLVLMSLALAMSLVRLVRGPSLPDRVVALDLMVAITIGMVAVGSILDRQASSLGPAMVLALIAFVGTVAYARYTEKGTVK